MRRLAPVILLLLVVSMPLHARDPLVSPTAAGRDRCVGNGQSPTPNWVQVRLPDGRTGWAPMTAVLAPATSPQSPERVVEVARRMLGAPYVWGGMSPNGADCSGFVQEVYRLAGHRLPRLADEQFAATAEVTAEELQPGDLVFFTTYLPGPSHVGIYLGDGRFLHASSSRGVTESSLDERYYHERYLGAHRPLAWLATPAPTPTPEAVEEDETAMP